MTKDQWIEIHYEVPPEIRETYKIFTNQEDAEKFINYNLQNEEYVIKICSRVNNKN